MVATLPCGRVSSFAPVAGGESLTQVYAMLSLVESRRQLQYVLYDNACALARFARHSRRCDRTPASQRLASLSYVLDALHEKSQGLS